MALFTRADSADAKFEEAAAIHRREGPSPLFVVAALAWLRCADGPDHLQLMQARLAREGDLPRVCAAAMFG